jgi:hypothetical protein
MRNEEPWLSFYTATHEMEQRFGMSRGAAQRTLRELCRSGEVRSQKQPYTMVNSEPQPEGPTERIEPSEWRERDIDCMTDVDGCRYLVDVSENDFRQWLSHKAKAPPAQKSPLRRDLAKQAVDALWPNEVPKSLVNKDIERAVANYMKANGLAAPSKETILRAAGRK